MLAYLAYLSLAAVLVGLLLLGVLGIQLDRVRAASRPPRHRAARPPLDPKARLKRALQATPRLEQAMRERRAQRGGR